MEDLHFANMVQYEATMKQELASRQNNPPSISNTVNNTAVNQTI